MTEITFITYPDVDEILIDGVPIEDLSPIDDTPPAPTPTPPPDDTTDIDIFRAECLSGGAVSCTWSALQVRLINRDIATFWWDLTESERRSIAEMAIKNTLFSIMRYGRAGKENCEGGEGDVGRIVCVQNGIIRTLKFGSYDVGGDKCYYRKSSTSKEFCYVPETSYGLPCHIVTCATASGSSDPFGHTMCSIQVVNNTDSLDNWIVFQYSDFDIKPGHWQMPSRDDIWVVFSNLTHVSCGGYGYKDVARFEHI